MLRTWFAISVLCTACGHKKDAEDRPTPVERPAAPAPAPSAPPAPPAPPEARPPSTGTGAGLAEQPSTAPGPTTPAVADAPAGNPPPDGKYERVVVEGVTVPMVSIMNGGSVVLVDTDGAKPRTWEEQYKKKTAKLAGQLDVHKTNANHNATFDDDAIDREGIWLIDSRGNITRH